MSTIGEINDALALARQVYSGLNADRITDLKRGCDDCVPVNYKCLKRLIKALEWEVSKGFVTDIAEKLLYCLLIIIGGGTIPVPIGLIAYYGSLPTRTILNQTQIIASSQTEFISGGDVKIPWNVSDLSYLWFAIPVGESIKNYFTDLSNPLNQSSIGTDEDLFGAPTVVGVYNFYITNYLSSYLVANPAIRGLVFTRLFGEDEQELNSTGFPIPID